MKDIFSIPQYPWFVYGTYATHHFCIIYPEKVWPSAVYIGCQLFTHYFVNQKPMKFNKHVKQYYRFSWNIYWPLLLLVCIGCDNKLIMRSQLMQDFNIYGESLLDYLSVKGVLN